MFVLQKILNFIIFPPSVFIIILLIALYFNNKSRRKTAFIIIADIILLYMLSIEPVKNLILAPLENYAAPIDLKEKHGAGYIVVLGGGSINSSPEEMGGGSLESDALKRALHGVYLSGVFKVPVIFSGGKLAEDQIESEADIAVKTMRRFTSEKTVLIKEGQSRTTLENAEFIKSRFNPGRVILVTSAYHMRRSLYLFNRAGIDCIPAPADYKIDRSGYNFTSFLPKTGEMDDIYKGLKEYVGLLFYMLKQ
jgi:uncharacterized SAM-binding protein YcdF (DUF218 family)